MVIDEHQQKQLETEGHSALAEGGTAAGTRSYQQTEEQQRPETRKTFPNGKYTDDDEEQEEEGNSPSSPREEEKDEGYRRVLFCLF